MFIVFFYKSMRFHSFSALVTMTILMMSLFGTMPFLSAQDVSSSKDTVPSRVGLNQVEDHVSVSNTNANDTVPVEPEVSTSIPAFTKERKRLRIMDSVMGTPRNGSRPDTLQSPTTDTVGRNPSAVGSGSAKANFQDGEPIRTANEYGFWRATYFRNDSRAELEYMLSIGYLNPNVNPTVYVELTNEDDTSGRYFYFYVDGVLKHSQIIHGPSTTVSFSCSSWCSSYSTYLIKVVIRYGGAGHGWRLDKIWINDATIAFNAYGSPHLNVSYQYPYQTLTAYDSNGEITPNFSNRWDDIPDHCATLLPSNWISDFEHILFTYPEFGSIYYFANYSGDPSPQNLFDFLSITEVTH